MSSDRTLSNAQIEAIITRQTNSTGPLYKRMETVSLAQDLLAARNLLDALVDADPCDFDHHGGCQAHMFLGLEAGEVCPNELTKRFLGVGDDHE